MREDFYRVGDPIQFHNERPTGEASGIQVIPGIHWRYAGSDKSKIIDTYYRIVICEGVIISVFATTEEDYESLRSILGSANPDE